MKYLIHSLQQRTYFIRSAIFVGAFLCSCRSLAAGVVEHGGSLTTPEIEKINWLCNELERKYFISTLVFVYTDDEPHRPKPSRSRDRMLFINIDLANQRIKTYTQPSETEAQNYDRLFSAVVNQFTLSGATVFPILERGLTQIKDREKQNAERLRKSLTTRRTLSSELKTYIGISVIFVLAFVFLFTIKGLKKGNNVENVEFYGFSRMSTIGAIFLCLVLLSIHVVLIFHYFESFERTIGLTCSVFTIYPLMILTASLLGFTLDWTKLSSYNSRPDEDLSLGARLYLLNPKIATEFLLETNFYQLITNQVLTLEVAPPAYNYNNSSFYYVHVETKNNKVLSPSLRILLKDQQDQSNLSSFLKTVYSSIGRFLAYRKDFIIKELLDAGLITRAAWLLNRFELTTKGEAVLAQVRKNVIHQHTLIHKLKNNPGAKMAQLGSLNEYVLLIPDLDNDMDLLKSSLRNANIHTGLVPDSLSIFFDDAFNFRAFNLTFLQAYNYKFDWSKAPDLTRWVPI